VNWKCFEQVFTYTNYTTETHHEILAETVYFMFGRISQKGMNLNYWISDARFEVTGAV
jgi:hypothetical protein